MCATRCVSLKLLADAPSALAAGGATGFWVAAAARASYHVYIIYIPTLLVLMAKVVATPT